jgi:hypothetical protein
MKTNNLNTASMQWATRPDDQRFTSLEELEKSVANRKQQSWTSAQTCDRLLVQPAEDEKGLTVQLYDPSIGQRRMIEPTNWAFNQLSQYANAPAAYIRKLPAPLAAINIQWGLENSPIRDEVLVLGQTNGENILRSMTSTSYGRIWDIDVVKAVRKANPDNRWQIPSASYATTNPKRATTLYASDRDVFIFLVDPENVIEVNGEKLFRGFITWNSEVGASVFGLTTFLYRYVCDNRIIWGATDVKELRIIHRAGAPDRFAYEGQKYLQRYAEESTAQIVETIKKASSFELPQSDKETDGWAGWLQKRGFTAKQSKLSIDTAMAEEGETKSLWNIINGITAYARTIPHTDARVQVETAAGNLLNVVKN